MNKNELIAALQKLCDEEEHAIPIYTKHLESTFFLSDFKPEIQSEIREMLLTLALESEVHARMFQAALKKVRESERDVY
jgi:rubrerythrin